jgi:DNA ligase-1
MADEITRSAMHTCGKDENGIGYALRFPRAQGFIRSDKNPEDATTVSEIITMSESQKLIKLA